jgi:lysophospholipase L1-like esterase
LEAPDLNIQIQWSLLDTTMKKLVFAIAWALLLSSCGTADNTAQKPIPGGKPLTHPIRILPLGDSITQGGNTDRAEYSYRYPLFYALKNAGYDIDFIGSLKQGLNADATWSAKNGVAFDPDHEGHYGWKTAAVRDKLGEWMQSYPAAPDIVLIHLGTNDLGEKDHDATVIKPMRDMIGLLRAKNPRVVVLIGHLNFNGGAALAIRPLVEQVAQAESTEQSPVLTVAHYEGWHANPAAPNTDTFDWAHPNPSGQQKMADRWLAAMRPHLDQLQKERAKKGR